MRRLIALLLALSLLVVVGAGCGGDDEETTTVTAPAQAGEDAKKGKKGKKGSQGAGASAGAAADGSGGAAAAPSGPSGPSKSRFISQADAICRQVVAAGKNLLPKLRRARDKRDLPRIAQLIDQGIAIATSGWNRIDALPAPAANRDLLSQVISGAKEALRLSRAVAAALRDQAFGRAGNLRKPIGAALLRSADAAKKYGFRVCGQRSAIS